MSTVWLYDPSLRGGRWEAPPDGRVFREIRTTVGRTAPYDRKAARTVAYVERQLPPGGHDAYRTARKDGVRAFALWESPYRERLLARVSTRAAAKGQPASYEVQDAGGASLAVITRTPARSDGAGRTRWTVQQTGREPAVGLKGRLFWWWVWWLILPVQVLIAVGSLVSGSGDGARMPRRIRWYAGGRRTPVLDWASGVEDFELDVPDEGWDPRVTAALVALLTSHAGLLGTAWDEAER
ncbi:hypothetical protein ACH4GK_37040 [Streptomyces rimosus]|uniref:hypothetical protein n=1 Tax=Streptomyces rimosus TaxID=1927 RepID=UPI0004C86B9D|nr:hypothetical protein [Streptomyces rimosus]